MQRLFVLYDARCGLCRWAKRWVELQERLVDVTFIAAGSDEARRLFPTLEHSETPEDLVVVSDDGGVYLGGSAWVMVLYALADYREWSLRLGSSPLLPLARRAFSLLSRHRQELSAWIHPDQNDDALAASLRRVSPDSCDLPLKPPAPELLPVNGETDSTPRVLLPDGSGRDPSSVPPRRFSL